MGVVDEFGRGLLKPLGAPAGRIETFIEVPFDLNGKKCQPDGLIRVTKGKRSWTALIEVKTGKNDLQTEQLESYLDVARQQGFDAVVTLSNQIPPAAGLHPTKVDKRKLRTVMLHHWSWAQVLSSAVVQKEHRGVSDPEQAWILGELIRYLEHPRSGAMELDDMGASWVAVREAVAAGTLRVNDASAPEIAARFDALLQYAGLRLGRQLGTDVVPAMSRKEQAEPAVRNQGLLSQMVNEGKLTGALRIPNTVAPIAITVDLRAGQVTCHVDLEAPRQGRATTRVNWAVRQLRHAPETTRIEAFVAHGRGLSSAELLGAVREDPSVLVIDAKREIRTFRVALSRPMGAKRGRGRGAFIDSVLDVLDVFYADVVQHLKAWAPAAPRLREPVSIADERPALTSTAISSQDGPEPDGHA